MTKGSNVPVLPVSTYDEWSWSYSLHMTGYASTLPSEEEDDKVRRLHAVVEEVTGKPVEAPPKKRMGFLP